MSYKNCVHVFSLLYHAWNYFCKPKLRLQSLKFVEICTCHCTKKKFSIKDFFRNCDQITRKLPNWSHLMKQSLTENFIFCAAYLSYHESFYTTNEQRNQDFIIHVSMFYLYGFILRSLLVQISPKVFDWIYFWYFFFWFLNVVKIHGWFA